MMRKRFFEEIEAMAGRHAIRCGVIRERQRGGLNVALPNMAREVNTEGLPLAGAKTRTRCCGQRLEGFRYHFGQPPEVRREFVEAMGIVVEHPCAPKPLASAQIGFFQFPHAPIAL